MDSLQFDLRAASREYGTAPVPPPAVATTPFVFQQRAGELVDIADPQFFPTALEVPGMRTLISHLIDALVFFAHRLPLTCWLGLPTYQPRLLERIALALFHDDHPGFAGKPKRSQLPDLTGVAMRLFPTARAQYFGATHGIHARKQYRGKSAYSWVMVDSGDPATPWFARLLLLIALGHDHATRKTLAVVQYLEEFHPPRPHVIDATHYRYFGVQPDAIPLASIMQPVRLVTSPLRGAHDSLVFLALPFGVSASSTRIGWTYDDSDDGSSPSTSEGDD